MFEVIIERPRRGAGWERKGRKKEFACDPELSPRREPMSISRGSKSLNENLAPLRRFLHSRVGQPWSKVYAEICEYLTPRSTVQKHVMDHVRGYVEENPAFIKGVPYDPAARGSRRDGYFRIGGHRYDGFYVCPRTGRLLCAPYTPRRKATIRRDARTIDENTEALRIDGVWYLVTFAKVPFNERHRCYDVVLRVFLSEPRMMWPNGSMWHLYGRVDRYAIAKRQMNKREIRAFVGG